MKVDWLIIATIAGPLVGVLFGVFLNRIIERRAQLTAYLGHVSAHRLKQADGTPYDVFTHSVVILNSGGKPATNVRLVHRILPSFSILPDIEHHVEDLPAGGKEIVFPTLVPKEQITISYLYFPPVTWDQINGPIKSDEGLANIIQVLPTRQYPKWFNRVVVGLMLIGLIAIIYVIFIILRWLILLGAT